MYAIYRKMNTLAIACLLTLASVSLAEAPGEPAKPFEPVAPEGMQLERNVPYGTQSRMQRLDILYPASASSPRPAIVHIHGGGWYTGGKEGKSTFGMLERFAAEGYVAVAIEYRLSDEAVFPAAVEDCKLVIRWLRANAEKYHIDPAHIGVIGDSAGGHLSAMLAVTRPSDGLDGTGGHADQSSAVQAAVPVCPPCDLRIRIAARGEDTIDPLVARFLGPEAMAKPDPARAVSPIVYVHKDAAPMFLIHGTDDKRVMPVQSQMMLDAMKQAGAPCELAVVEGGNQGMAIARTDDMMSRIVAFFNAHLKSK